MLEYILSVNLTHTAKADKGVGSNVPLYLYSR